MKSCEIQVLWVRRLMHYIIKLLCYCVCMSLCESACMRWVRVYVYVCVSVSSCMRMYARMSAHVWAHRTHTLTCWMKMTRSCFCTYPIIVNLQVTACVGEFAYIYTYVLIVNDKTCFTYCYTCFESWSSLIYTRNRQYYHWHCTLCKEIDKLR